MELWRLHVCCHQTTLTICFRAEVHYRPRRMNAVGTGSHPQFENGIIIQVQVGKVTGLLWWLLTRRSPNMGLLFVYKQESSVGECKETQINTVRISDRWKIGLLVNAFWIRFTIDCCKQTQTDRQIAIRKCKIKAQLHRRWFLHRNCFIYSNAEILHHISMRSKKLAMMPTESDSPERRGLREL